MQSGNNCLFQHPRKRTCSFSNRSKMASDRAYLISIFLFLFVFMLESRTRYVWLAIFTHTSSFSVENYPCSKWCYRVTGFLYSVDYRRVFKSYLVAYMAEFKREIAHKRMTTIYYEDVFFIHYLRRRPCWRIRRRCER